MAEQYVLSKKRVINSSGEVMSGALLYVYEAGTTTPIDTYSDEDFTTPNANPIVADSTGIFGSIFLQTDKYKFELQDSSANLQWTQDNYEVLSGFSFTEGLEVTGTTVRVSSTVSEQVGTSYTVQAADRAKLITHSNASAIAVTLPQAGTSTFTDGWYYWTQNRGAGTVTITPTTSTIDGAASVDIKTNEGYGVFSDGTNYFTMRGSIPDSIGDLGDVTVTSVATDDGLYWNGSAWANSPRGRTLQQVESMVSTTSSTTTTIPYDNTIPQITEGAEFATVAITPKDSASTLIIEAEADFSSNASDEVIFALFVDSTADALATAIMRPGNGSGQMGHINFSHSLTSGSTTARTYRLRYGPRTNTAYINSNVGTSLFGGTMKSGIRVTEIL